MPICRSCGKDLPRDTFSSTQRKEGKWRCKSCTHLELTGEAAAARVDTHDALRYSSRIKEVPEDIVHVSDATQIRELEEFNRDSACATLVAFDAEWWSQSSDAAGVHVLQLAFPESRRVYVLQVQQIGHALLKEAFSSTFLRPECKVVGWGIRQDLKRLSHTSPLLEGISSQDIVDIQMLAGIEVNRFKHGVAANAGFFRPRLDDAAETLLKVQCEKDYEVTMSDWSAARLSKVQVRYAAMDAWITLRLYLFLAGALAPRLTCASDPVEDKAEAPSCSGSTQDIPNARNLRCDRCGLVGFNSQSHLNAYRGGKKCLKLCPSTHNAEAFLARQPESIANPLESFASLQCELCGQKRFNSQSQLNQLQEAENVSRAHEQVAVGLSRTEIVSLEATNRDTDIFCPSRNCLRTACCIL
eukprot:TRINITY_DN18266_c0_g1_i1.p1 TRINITY_DN18266_c0_g1~~TRINITY_DN18266_c0_g1_i1.p1  ORF type:complete len:429 (+),score=47.97 TRINITY_DN18266_c0_g1_i1:47-1288(+)